MAAAGGHGSSALEADRQGPVGRLQGVRPAGVGGAFSRGCEGLQVTGGGGEAAAAAFGQFNREAEGDVAAECDRQENLFVEPEIG